MMDAIHATALSAQRFTFESGKKTLHGDATNRILRIFAAIGDVSYFYFLLWMRTPSHCLNKTGGSAGLGQELFE
jgi:hypothetical protein